MNKHISDGNLRAALDGELAEPELQHLKSCPACQARMEQIRLQVLPALESLSFLGALPDPQRITEEDALIRFHQLTSIRKENSMFKRLFASPILRIGLAVVLIMVIVLSIPATRALADQFLSLFRVEQVVVIPVDYSGMQVLTGNGVIGAQISELISGSVITEQKPGTPVTATDANQASQLAGFTVRLPQGTTPSSINVDGAAAYSFKVDLAKAQALLNEAGRPDLVLPASIDGATVSVNIPASVSINFGACPQPGAVNGANASTNGSVGRRYPDCVIMEEIPSPTVSAPAEVNIAQLAQLGLEFTGMTKEQAAAFAQTVDWTSSLVVPIPKNAATYQQVPVDGVTGTLIQRPADDASQYILVWVKNGIIYAIGALGNNSQQAIQMANSLP